MRNEYPRPDFIREKWIPLNGTWNFQDGTDKTPVKIQVPFPPQSRLSGFQKELTSDRITYQRNFFIPAEWIGQRILLHFGAVDYKCSVFINDHCVGFHEGGQSSFTFDITDFLSGGEETLTVAVTDYLHDETVPRGKQFWKSSGEFIWYTQSSGIWQSVWLEPVNEAHLEKLCGLSSDCDFVAIRPEAVLISPETLNDAVHFQGKITGVMLRGTTISYTIDCDGIELRADTLFETNRQRNMGEMLQLQILKEDILHLH